MRSIQSFVRAFFLLMAAVFAFALAGCAASPDKAADASGTEGKGGAPLSIHVLDIGQGDAILLEKDGKWALIDSGDVDEREHMTAHLKRYGVKELQSVIITHPHADHVGGMYAVFKAVKVDHIYDNGQAATTNTYRTYLKMIKSKNIPYTAAKGGDTITLLPGVSFKVTGPVKIMKDKKGRPEANNNSVAGRLTYGAFTMFFTGDAEKEEEMDMIRAFPSDLKSDVLKVGHHGSKTSSSAQFLEKVKPKDAIISAGKGNSYGLPHEITLKKLQKIGANLFRTDRDGTVTVKTDGSHYTITKEHS